MELESISTETMAEAVAYATDIRRKLHSQPELTWKEYATGKFLAEQLATFPKLTVDYPVAETGVIARLKGGKTGPTIALRADMDALPLTEQTGVSYRSQTDGVMHACGHDGHMANLLGAIRILHDHSHEICGELIFVFQPAEEGGAGAKKICESGALADADGVFGLHGWPELELGKFYVKDGAAFAANAILDIQVKGQGCHGAMPHLGTDQILIGARIVEQIQSIASRMTAPTEPVVVTIGEFHAGTTDNIIPETAHLRGTIRAMSSERLQVVSDRIAAIATAVASSHGAEAEVNIKPCYPAVINHKGATDYLRSCFKKHFREDPTCEMPAPTMGSEDFSFYLQERPGSYFLLGLSAPDWQTHSLHSPFFDFNDKALTFGIRAFLAIVADMVSFPRFQR